MALIVIAQYLRGLRRESAQRDTIEGSKCERIFPHGLS